MLTKARFALSALLLATATSHTNAVTFTSEASFHDCRGLICIDVALDNAKPRTLLLDTGNVNSSLMADTAAALRWNVEPILREGKEVPGIKRGGTHRVRLGNDSSEAKFLVFDRTVFGDNPPPADGTLAYTFFKDRVLQIDYPHRKLRISNVITTPSPTSSATGTLQLITFGNKGPPIVVGAPFWVNGKSVHAQIDTCFTGTLLVYDAAIDSLDLRELLKKGKPEYFPDTDGGVNMLAAPVKRLGFDKMTLTDSKTKVYFSADGKNAVHQPDGLFEATVGNALFANSVVTLDFHSMTLDVTPAS